MFEEDLFFPGREAMDDDSDSDHTDTEQTPPSDSNHSEDYAHSSAFGGPHDTPSPTFATSVTAFSGRHSLADSFEGEIALSEQTEEDEAQDLLAQVIVDYGNLEQDHRVNVKTTDRLSRPSSLLPPGNPIDEYGDAALDTRGIAETALPPLLTPRIRGLSLTSSEYTYAASQSHENSHGSAEGPSPPPLNPKYSPFLLRTIPKPPANPRDHSIIEFIYNQMLGSRFINLSPLALLANSLGLYFKGNLCYLRNAVMTICLFRCTNASAGTICLSTCSSYPNETFK